MSKETWIVHGTPPGRGTETSLTSQAKKTRDEALALARDRRRDGWTKLRISGPGNTEIDSEAIETLLASPRGDG